MHGVKQGFTLRSVWRKSSQPAPLHQKDAGGKPEDLMSGVGYIPMSATSATSPQKGRVQNLGRLIHCPDPALGGPCTCSSVFLVLN